MARRRATPPPVPDALRDAVDRTVQATRGGARTRAQDVVDDVVQSTRGRAQDAMEGVVKGAGRVREAFEEARPATHDDVKELRKELRAINRRLAAIEERLPPPKPAPKKKS